MVVMVNGAVRTLSIVLCCVCGWERDGMGRRFGGCWLVVVT